MKRMMLNKKQVAEMKRVAKFFLEATEILEPNKHLRAAVDVKILSRLGCFADKFTGHLNKNQKWEEC
jgi:hypothetical protein